MIKTGVSGFSRIFHKKPSTLIGAAEKAMQRRGNTTARSALKTFGTFGAITAGTAIAGLTVPRQLGQFRRGLIKGIYPGSSMPLESGRFGVRTTSTPAGISGIRFNFRRR